MRSGNADIEAGNVETVAVSLSPHGLAGTLAVPDKAFALIIFAHGSGSSRLSPRNVKVADSLNRAGMATLLFDLLQPQEEAEHNRAKVFDIRLLAGRLIDAVRWVDRHTVMKKRPIGFFGASTGAAAALAAAALLKDRVGAVVSRGGRPDLAGSALPFVQSPTLLIVGGHDQTVLEMNRSAFSQMTCLKTLEVIPGATHLFPEPGALERVTTLATRWFDHHLKSDPI